MPYGPIQLFWLETAGRPFEGAVPLRTLLKCHTAASPFWRETASRRFKAAVALRTLAKWLTATTQVWLETAGRHPTPLPYLTAQATFLTGDGPPADWYPRSDRLQQRGRPTPFVAQVTVRCRKYVLQGDVQGRCGGCTRWSQAITEIVSGAGGGVGVERTHLERKPFLGSRSSDFERRRASASSSPA